MSNRADTRLQLAELYALDLETDTDEQLRILRRLQEDLQFKHAIGLGAFDVARERFEAAARRADTLVASLRAHRELVNDLRATLEDLRRTLRAGGQAMDRRAVLPDDED